MQKNLSGIRQNVQRSSEVLREEQYGGIGIKKISERIGRFSTGKEPKTCFKHSGAIKGERMQMHDFFKWMQKQWQEFLLDDYSLIQGG